MSPDVRAAADLLKDAIDQHLQACSDKTAEGDPRVQEAYDAVREAAESYDDALFDAFDEVTPFEFSQGPIFEAAEVVDERMPARVSVFQRRDFAVRSADTLLAVAVDLLKLEGEEDAELEGLTAVEALGVQLEALGLDQTVVSSDDMGLHWLGGTTWVVAQDAGDDTMISAPFAAVDEARLLHRLDEDVIG